MAWTDPVDIYCERLGPGLWAEPLNAVSNLGFVIAGLLLLRLTWRHRGPRAVQVLPAVMLLIGLGSAAFHTYANGWSQLLDVLFIALYICWFVACYARYRWSAPWWFAVVCIGLFLAASQLLTKQFEPRAFNGSVGYLPALAGLVIFGGLSTVRDGLASSRWFFMAAVTFAISLSMRTVDQTLCAAWPYGTHWAWHLLNALTLAFATLAIRSAPRLQQGQGWA